MRNIARRKFMKSAAAVAGAVGLSLVEPKHVFGSEANSRVKLGVVGCGGRGRWIAGLFARHKGYEIYAVADYFREVADAAGGELGVDAGRRFWGLDGYKKLIASGVDAVALETPPYSFPSTPAPPSRLGCTSTWPSPSPSTSPARSRSAS
jgi:myo-inositol 2-dehydrogenase/D-chiro-inositol 1-dehydrogenase